jgi:hypothetical protein
VLYSGVLKLVVISKCLNHPLQARDEASLNIHVMLAVMNHTLSSSLRQRLDYDLAAAASLACCGVVLS